MDADVMDLKKALFDYNDCSAYKPGVKISEDTTIVHVASQGSNYVIYYTEEDFSVQWTSNGVAADKIERLREIDSVMALAQEKFLGVHHPAVDAHYSIAISSVLSGQGEEGIHKAVEELKERIASTPKTKRVIALSRKLQVWINGSSNLDYNCNAITKEERRALHGFRKSFAHAQSVLLGELDADAKEKASLKIGIAFTEAFSCAEESEIDNIYADVRHQIKEIAENILKSNYLWLATFLTCFFVLLSFVAYYFYLLPDSLRPALIPVAGGFVGTYLSVLARSNELVISDLNSDKLVLLQGMLRVLMGGIFGLLAYALAMSGLAFSLFKEGTYSLLLLGAISGFSERLVPDLIDTLSRGSDNPR
ncbi:hypothetical protein ACQKEK_01710 [Pseudomonas sp. NPDC077408]